MEAVSDPLPNNLKDAKEEIKRLRKSVMRPKYYIAKLEAEKPKANGTISDHRY